MPRKKSEMVPTPEASPAPATAPVEAPPPAPIVTPAPTPAKAPAKARTKAPVKPKAPAKAKAKAKPKVSAKKKPRKRAPKIPAAVREELKDERWLSSAQVRARYGNIGESTLYRWVNEDAFPDATLFGARLRRWDVRELDAFDAHRKIVRDSAKSVRRAKRIEREERETRQARGEPEAVPVPQSEPSA